MDHKVKTAIGVLKSSKANEYQRRAAKKILNDFLGTCTNEKESRMVRYIIDTYADKDDSDTLEAKENQEEPFDLKVGRKWVQLRQSALRRGKEFDLTFSDVSRLLKRKTCAYTGLPFQNSDMQNRTIDRLDPEKGYVKGNVYAVHNAANAIKSTFEGSDGNFAAASKAGFSYTEKVIRKIKELGFGQ